MNGSGGKIATVFLGAAIGDQLSVMAAAAKLLRQRRGGKEMPSRAAGREQNRAAGQAACPRARAGAGRACRRGRSKRWALGRLRVRPRAKPMVSDMASRDDPP